VRDAGRLEVEDAFFNTSSAVFLPDVPGGPLLGGTIPVPFTNAPLWVELQRDQGQFATEVFTKPFDPEASGGETPQRVSALHVIIAALRFCEQNQSHKLVIAGHTDRSGDDALNMRLSDARGKSVLSLLEGKRADFVKACSTFHAPEDDPIVLHYAARTRGWPCDPADQTKATPAEIRAFQERFNTDFSAKIAVDGRVGDEMHGAYFDLYDADLATEAGGKTELANLRSQLRFVDTAHKVLPCGERFPLENPGQDGFKSQRNRRVEMLFFAPPRLPVLGGADAAEKIFKRKLFTFTPLDRDVLALKPARAVAETAPATKAVTLTVGDVQDGEEEIRTSMPNAGKRDPTDPYVFLTPFDELHPNEGRRPRRPNSKPLRTQPQPPIVVDPPLIS
jgi:hypothetical protein